jgi:HSP20 family protein
MANITRYDPFGLARVDPFADIDDMFKGFFMRPVLFEGKPQMEIKMDLKEDDKAYTVHAEIPGVKKEDIQVSIDGNRVSISAETKTEKEEKEGEKVLHSERYYGKVARNFTLANDVDEAKAKAKYADGVLELTLPKKEGATTARKLAVH